MKNQLKALWKEEKGDIGIKQIAMTVAAIVVIGLLVQAVQGNLPTWVTQVWDMFIEQIEGLIS